MCIHPLGGRANSSPGTPFVFSGGCGMNRIKICYNTALSSSTEGDLQHVSGHCLVPASSTDTTWNNMEIVLGPCGVSYSRWRLTGEGNIKHVSSGRCWHPLGGGAWSGNKVILHDGCGREQRLTFNIV